MLVEDGKVGSDKKCSDINVIEFLVREGEGVAVELLRSSTMRWESFNFSNNFLTALRWDMGEGGSVICFDSLARRLRLRNLLLLLLRLRLFLASASMPR